MQDVKEGDVIFSLPLDMVLAHRSSEEEFDAQLGENLDEFTALSVKLLRERAQGEESPYHHYLQVGCLASKAVQMKKPRSPSPETFVT